MVPAPSHRVSRVPWYSGSCQAAHNFGYGAITLSGRLSQSRSPVARRSLMQSEPRHARMPVWALPRSLAATGGIDVSFSSSGYLDVSVPRVPLHGLWIQPWMAGGFPAGFPHSDIRGSLDMCSSPRLFAAYHVFHRLPVPGHPPCALLCLTSPWIDGHPHDSLKTLSMSPSAVPSPSAFPFLPSVGGGSGSFAWRRACRHDFICLSTCFFLGEKLTC